MTLHRHSSFNLLLLRTKRFLHVCRKKLFSTSYSFVLHLTVSARNMVISASPGRHSPRERERGETSGGTMWCTQKKGEVKHEKKKSICVPSEREKGCVMRGDCAVRPRKPCTCGPPLDTREWGGQAGPHACHAGGPKHVLWLLRAAPAPRLV